MPSALARFRPPPPAVPAVVRRDGVPASAWHGQLRDGALRVVWGDVAAPAGLRLTPEVRVRAIADLVPDRAVIGRSTALWVHTGRHRPDRVEVLVHRRTRPVAPNPHRVCAEADLPDADLSWVAGLRVTTVQRTGVDLARWLPTDAAVPLVADLLTFGFDPELAARDLRAMTGERHVRSARRTLALVRR
ncbi:hypothetical protein IC607_07010 [Cellulomonas sp. JH27-2]|uniref:hypothetical protein n=1 Tax=Cellulomonas sp. JH27-2 TaxID=2774139 RepID=UPI00178462E1|nr:hypothetical protein [Cellulomonas sp. JH27-2]MBD8058712.1 hypothetical protein [Cellulomonas sp. JH27-2]